MAAPQRPNGIVILVILEVIGALGLLLTGFAGLVGGAFLGVIASGPLGAFVAIIGVFSLLLGIIGLLIAWGLWAGKGWAWTVAFILTILNIIINIPSVLVGIGIIGLLINLLIIYYLTRPHVKAFYGKESSPSYNVQQAPPPPPP